MPESKTSYVSGDAEKVSIDAFNKSYYGSGGVVVGITFVKVSLLIVRHFSHTLLCGVSLVF